MAVEITIVIDKEVTKLINTNIGRITEKIVGFVNICEKLITVKTEDLAEESTSVQAQEQTQAQTTIQEEQELPVKPEPETAKRASVVKREKSKVEKSSDSPPKKITALGIVFHTIKKSDQGINVDDLKKETGFDSRKVADAVYRLKKNGKIDKTNKGLYIAKG